MDEADDARERAQVLERLRIPSDLLPWFESMPQGTPIAAAVAASPVTHLRFVLDANAILQDIRLYARANDSTMRPSIEELIDNGVVRAVAPAIVRAQVEEHVPEVTATLPPTQQVRARDAWARYRAKIEWLDVDTLDALAEQFPVLARRDPTDLPIAAAGAVIGADAIITDDTDLVDTTAIARRRHVIAPLRDYVRSKTIALATALGDDAWLLLLVAAFADVAKRRPVGPDPTGTRMIVAVVLVLFAVVFVIAYPAARAAARAVAREWIALTAVHTTRADELGAAAQSMLAHR